MWLKVLLLSAYLFGLFLLSRLLEAETWYEAGFFSYKILDPFTLSVRKLKRLLEIRGVSYAGVVEKKELTHLVEASGEVHEGELVEATLKENATTTGTPVTHFTSGTHFYEEVEDSKDSIWLVQVVPPSGHPLLDDLTWQRLRARISPFGVRTGMFDCSVDLRLCQRKGWLSFPHLILGLPTGCRAKDNVVMLDYPRMSSPRPQAILDWIRHHLMARVKEISSSEELWSWLTYSSDSKQSEVRVLLISALVEPPLFLLALGVKFSGRVRVGMVNDKDKEKAKMLSDVKTNNKLPIYLVITPEKTLVYGKRVGEYLNYHRMGLFLKSLHPETNDIFLVSLILVNLLVGLDFFFIQGRLWRHIIKCFWQLGTANCLLFLVWLFILGLGHFPFVDYVTDLCLKGVRILTNSNLVTLLRNDWHYWCNDPTFLLLSFGCYVAIAIYLIRRYKKSSEEIPVEQSESNSFDWWSSSLDGYLMDCFFRPMVNLNPPPIPASDLDLEEGLELLIERLAVPNLWLQPVIPADYIKDLPVWIHCSKLSSSSGDESGSIQSEASESDDGRFSENREDFITTDDEGSLNECSTSFPSSHAFSCTCKTRSVNSSNRFSAASTSQPSEMTVKTSLVTCKTCQKQVKQHRGYKHHSRERNSIEDKSKSQKTSDSELSRGPPAGMLDCNECAICLELYKNSAILCGLPCGHNYHHHCINLWLLRDNHHCPVCRWPTYKTKHRACSFHLHSE